MLRRAICLVIGLVWMGGIAPEQEAGGLATITEIRARRDVPAASRSSGVARVSYDGKTVDYCSIAEIARAIEVLDREIAAA